MTKTAFHILLCILYILPSYSFSETKEEHNEGALLFIIDTPSTNKTTKEISINTSSKVNQNATLLILDDLESILDEYEKPVTSGAKSFAKSFSTALVPLSAIIATMYISEAYAEEAPITFAKNALLYSTSAYYAFNFVFLSFLKLPEEFISLGHNIVKVTILQEFNNFLETNPIIVKYEQSKIIPGYNFHSAFDLVEADFSEALQLNDKFVEKLLNPFFTAISSMKEKSIVNKADITINSLNDIKMNIFSTSDIIGSLKGIALEIVYLPFLVTQRFSSNIPLTPWLVLATQVIEQNTVQYLSEGKHLSEMAPDLCTHIENYTSPQYCHSIETTVYDYPIFSMYIFYKASKTAPAVARSLSNPVKSLAGIAHNRLLVPISAMGLSLAHGFLSIVMFKRKQAEILQNK